MFQPFVQYPFNPYAYTLTTNSILKTIWKHSSAVVSHPLASLDKGLYVARQAQFKRIIQRIAIPKYLWSTKSLTRVFGGDSVATGVFFFLPTEWPRIKRLRLDVWGLIFLCSWFMRVACCKAYRRCCDILYSLDKVVRYLHYHTSLFRYSRLPNSWTKHRFSIELFHPNPSTRASWVHRTTMFGGNSAKLDQTRSVSWYFENTLKLRRGYLLWSFQRDRDWIKERGESNWRRER